nr:hypothetical protein CTI12_AA501740 [Tanacetum cinerariifolium]
MSGDMNVPKQVSDVLPCDPFEQIDIARKITSIALSTRVSSLESESSILQQHIAARDDVIVDLESKLHSFDFSLSQDLHNLSLADHQKVQWNSRRDPEFTWDREDQFKKKYPHLFTKTAPSSSAA